MSKTTNIITLAAALAFGVAMLAPVSADAKNWGGYGGGGMKPSGGYGGGMKPGGWGGKPGGYGGYGGYKPGHVHYRPYYRPHWHYGYGYRRHFWVAPVATYAVARPVVAAAPGPCTCLTKEYTPEGAVLFKDRCTNEMAMNPPVQAAPQQTGYQTAPGQPQQAYVPTYPGPAQAQPVSQ
ncbi:MAG: hypothetical protein AB1490_25730 [Pseudomonadota bacterium]